MLDQTPTQPPATSIFKRCIEYSFLEHIQNITYKEHIHKKNILKQNLSNQKISPTKHINTQYKIIQNQLNSILK